jgi:hypothetical protein
MLRRCWSYARQQRADKQAIVAEMALVGAAPLPMKFRWNHVAGKLLQRQLWQELTLLCVMGVDVPEDCPDEITLPGNMFVDVAGYWLWCA